MNRYNLLKGLVKLGLGLLVFVSLWVMVFDTPVQAACTAEQVCADYVTIDLAHCESSGKDEYGRITSCGLDYYNKSAFEFVSSDLGAQNAVAGGGRYDTLVELLGGKSTAGIGFAIGIERMLDMIETPSSLREGYYYGALCDEAVDKVYVEANKKRESEKVTIAYQKKSLKNHLKAADKAGAKYCAIIGENELRDSKIWIKN